MITHGSSHNTIATQLLPGNLKVGNNDVTGNRTQAAAERQAQAANEIVTALNKHLATTGAAPIEDLDPDDYTPKSVSDRILGFIDRAVGAAKARGASDEELTDMMTQARKGVNQGFKEAEDILKNLNALTDDVQATIDDTHGLVMDGLDDRTKLLNGLADTYAIDTTQRASQVDRYSSVAYAEAKSYEMQIETADGDLVTLSIARESAYAQTNRSQQQNGESLFISESARFDSMQVAYSISGDIDDGEREAIMDLVHQVDAVANEFFGGDMQAAMQSASGIQFDTSELDAYAFSLKHSESLTTKQSYQAVQEYSEQPPTEAPSSARADAKSAILGAAESFMEKMLELMDKAREESRIQDAPMVATNLLKEAIKADPRLPENIQQAPADQAVDKLVDQLSDNL